MAADRFLDNPAMGAQELRAGHIHATLERIRAQEVVLFVHDTTCLHDGTTQPQKGRGLVKVKARAEPLRHPTVLLPPARLNLGGLGLQRGQRPEPPVAQERYRTPRAATERCRWRAGDQRAGEVQQCCPDTLVVSMADREGAMHAWLLAARQRVPGDRAAFISRAQGHRRLANGQEPRDVWAEMQKARAAGRLTGALTRQPDRPPRPVPLRVAVKRVTVTGARRPGGRLPPVAVVAVDAKERRPPRGEEPVEWLWLTSLPVADFPSACPVVQW